MSVCLSTCVSVWSECECVLEYVCGVCVSVCLRMSVSGCQCEYVCECVECVWVCMCVCESEYVWECVCGECVCICNYTARLVNLLTRIQKFITILK